MATAIIIDNESNESLLRFTETKLFFDAKNQGTDFVQDALIVDSKELADEKLTIDSTVIVISTGDYLTTNFRNTYRNKIGIIYPTEQDEIIKFDLDTYVGFERRCKYPQGSKQLYIIENLLKTILRNRELVYLDNTEPYTKINDIPRHLYGLASGWKTVDFAQQIGLKNLESITVYDINPKQLEYAKNLHDCKLLPEKVLGYEKTCGEYAPPSHIKEFWSQWHEYPVKFKLLDLFTIPIFPKDSLIWISNIFQYEPNIFKFGWQKCKEAKQRLINSNKECKILIK